MGRRWLGLALALAAVGVGAGYVLGAVRQEDPAAFGEAAPVPATSPSIPVIPPTVLPDPTILPPLTPGTPLVPRTVGAAPFSLVVPVPAGWVSTNPASGEWRWYPPPGPDRTQNTYFLRVRLIGNSYRTVTSVRDGRIADLRAASDVADFHLEQTSPNGFVANYVVAEHRRVTMDAFLKPPDTQYADAWVGVVGRESDRAGLADLLRRVAEGTRR
jgi:hypothetical protein